MKRELVIAALLLVSVAAPYQAYLSESISKSISSESANAICWLPTTSPFARCQTYSVEYQGYLDVQLSGRLREISVSTAGKPAIVTGLELANGTLLRVSFYCRNGSLVWTNDRATATGMIGGFTYCKASQLPFQDGQELTVKGTFIIPSEWNPVLSTPTLTFAGDLYVFEIS